MFHYKNYLEYTVSKFISVTETKFKLILVQLWTLVYLIISETSFFDIHFLQIKVHM